MEKILCKAEKKAESAEIYRLNEQNSLIRTSQGKIETSKTGKSKGYGLRITRNSSTGYSYFSEKKHADKAIKTALKLAKMNKNPVELPLTKKTRKTKTFDKKIQELDFDDLARLIRRINKGTNRHAETLKSQISTYIVKVRVINSRGTDLQKKSTSFLAYAVGKKKKATGIDYYFKKKFSPKVTEVGEKAGKIAKKSAGGKPLSFTGDIVIDPEVLSSFLEKTVLRDVNGKKIDKGQSNWNEKIGEKVSDEFNLTDDPFLDYGAGTTSFDDEAVPTSKTTLIKKGVLKNFLDNLETSRESTGNGFRSNYSSTPSIDTTNIVLEPPERENVFDVKKGVFVKNLSGFHNMNASTGDFALNIGTGFRIKNGKKTKPVRGCMLTGNFYNMINKIKGFHEEDEQKTWFKGPAIRYKGKIVGS